MLIYTQRAPTILVNRMVLNLRSFWHDRNDIKPPRLPIRLVDPAPATHIATQDRWIGDIHAPIPSSSWTEDEDACVDDEEEVEEEEEIELDNDALTTLVPVVSRSDHLSISFSLPC